MSDSVAYNENRLFATSETLEGMGTSFECSDFWDHLGGQRPNDLRNRFAENLYCNQVIGDRFRSGGVKPTLKHGILHYV